MKSDSIRAAVERSVSAWLGRSWRVQRLESRAESASHPAAVMSDGTCPVFVKLREGLLGPEQLEREAAGLRLLTGRAGVLTPEVIGVIAVEEGALAILEGVRTVRRRAAHWREIGRTMARIHGVKADRFGLETDCYWGDLFQDNSPLGDWPEFFWRRRVEPRLAAAVDSGNLPAEAAGLVESLAPRLRPLCGPPTPPSLLHGDAHQNNFLSTALGPVAIDPAVYYGHPEVDLAAVDFFAPVPEELFRGYREMAPIDPGFSRRRDLWRVPAWLAMIEVDGQRHLAGLTGALRSCLGLKRC